MGIEPRNVTTSNIVEMRAMFVCSVVHTLAARSSACAWAARCAFRLGELLDEPKYRDAYLRRLLDIADLVATGWFAQEGMREYEQGRATVYEEPLWPCHVQNSSIQPICVA